MVLPPNAIKICSLRRPEQAEWVVEAEANMFGLIFAESRRRVSIEDAAAIVRRSREAGTSGRPLAVGVFVDHSADEINRITDRVGLDLVQHHRPDLLVESEPFERPVLLAYRTASDVSAADILANARLIQEIGVQVAGILIDGFKDGSHGGTGTVADWSVAAEVAREVPVMLAGGLHPENVGAGIGTVRPAGVDVSSGVEVDGVKDRARIAAFVAAARSGFAALLRNVDGVPLGQTAEPVQRA